MIKILKYRGVFFFISLLFFILPIFVHAEDFKKAGMGNILVFFDYSGYGMLTDPVSPIIIVSKILSTLISLIGIVLVCFMIYAGFLWMTAQGNTKQVQDAQKIVKNAGFGTIMVFSAYIIVFFVTRTVSYLATPVDVSSQESTSFFQAGETWIDNGFIWIQETFTRNQN